MPSPTPATRVLDAAGATYVLRPYDHDPATRAYGDEVVARLGVPGERVFKTLVVTSERGLAVGIVAVPARLDAKALAAVLGVKKVSLAPAEDAERATGYRPGGTSPFGQRRPLPTVVDVSALDQPTVIVSAGRLGLQVEVSPADLVRITAATVAHIAVRPPPQS